MAHLEATGSTISSCNFLHLIIIENFKHFQKNSIIHQSTQSVIFIPKKMYKFIGLSWPTIVTRPHMSPAPTKISRPKFKNSAKVDKTTVYVRLGTNSVSTH